MTTTQSTAKDSTYSRGVLMVLCAGICLSTGGLIVRHIETADGWQIMFYRATSFVVTLLIFLAVRYRGRVVQPFKSIGVNGLLVAMFLGLGSICYLFAILLTTVANAMFIISAAPFFTAAAAWLLLGERVRAITWCFMAAALAGIGLMFVDGFVTGRWLGNVLALGVVASFVGMLVVIRQSKAIDMVPASCLGGVVAGIISVFMVDTFWVSRQDLILCVLLGSAQFGAGFILITMGTRLIAAAEVALLALTETVLAPIWVWLVINEIPSVLTLLGGAVVLSAVVSQAVLGIRMERKAFTD
ncbi:MAG: DMT family transporter [Gammaproteobacteria bacterium]|nr:DMT family transporter [Gammaproteobacteria bacterium]